MTPAIKVPRNFVCHAHGPFLIARDPRLGDGSLLVAEYMYQVLNDARFREMVQNSLDNQTRLAYWLEKISPGCCWLASDARVNAYNAAIGLRPTATFSRIQVKVFVGIDGFGGLRVDIPDEEFKHRAIKDLAKVYLEPLLLQLRNEYEKSPDAADAPDEPSGSA